MKEVSESNKIKPQHIFICAMMVNLMVFFIWKVMSLMELEILNLNYTETVLSFIELVTGYSSLYFLVWIEKRIGRSIKLKLPVLGMILSDVIVTIINFAYPLTTISYSRLALFVPSHVLMVIFVYFLLKKKESFSSEFNFIGISFMISKLVLIASPLLGGYILDNYYTNNNGFIVLDILKWIIVLPKVAILMLMIKSLKERTEIEIETVESY